MELQEWFLMSHSHVHTRSERLYEKLGEDQLRRSPGEKLNSIVWLIWHVARCEDVMVNSVLRNVPEVLDHGEWLERLNVTTRHIGTEDTHEEMVSFSSQVDVAMLQDYWRAVGQETQHWITGFDFDGLNERITEEDVQRAKERGAFGPRAGWVETLWASNTRGHFLSWLAIGHTHSHIGEGFVIRSFLL